jgi:hypothetical protein
MTPTPDERAQIRAAMDRILAGAPERSSGALTIVALAIEASVPRNALTQRHTDLKYEFYQRIREAGADNGGEFGFQHYVLQPGIGARPRACVQDSPGRIFPLVVAGIQQRGEQAPGKSRVPGAAGMEGQQQPPLVGGRTEGGGVLVQGRSGLIGELKRRRALAAGAE